MFVALGGDETLSRGIDDSLRKAWPQRVFMTALPRSAVYVNLASEDATVRQGLADQVARAVELKATIATVWFGSGDARVNTDASAFTRDLTKIVEQLRAGGVTKVLLLSRTSSGAGGGSRYVAQIKKVAEQTGVSFIELPGSSNNPADQGSQQGVADAVKAKLVP